MMHYMYDNFIVFISFICKKFLYSLRQMKVFINKIYSNIYSPFFMSW